MNESKLKQGRYIKPAGASEDPMTVINNHATPKFMCPKFMTAMLMGIALIVSGGPALAQHGGGGGGGGHGGGGGGHGGGGGGHGGGGARGGGGGGGGGHGSYAGGGGHYASAGGGHAGAAYGGGGNRGGYGGNRGGYAGGYGGYRGGYGGGYRGGYGWRGGYGGWGWGGVGLGIGLYFATLPFYYSTVWWGGVPYYYADDNYYTWDGSAGQYETVTPPAQVQQQVEAQPPTLIAYPKNGQSDAQQATDKTECQTWAASQSGYVPNQPAATTPTASAGATAVPSTSRSDYMRAQAACLEGRGYSVN
jgi:hypothetical protein